MRLTHIYKMCCAPQGKRNGMTRQVRGLGGAVTDVGLCIHQHAFGKHGFCSSMHISWPFHAEAIGKFLVLQDLGLGERGLGLHGQLSHSHPSTSKSLPCVRVLRGHSHRELSCF